MKPYAVAIDLTYRCNLRCLHCYNQSGIIRPGEIELTEVELSNVLEDVSHLFPQSICFCGGEPTIRKEIIYSGARIIKSISSHTNVNFVTNGQLIQESDYDEIRDSGITMVQVSLDGFRPQTHDWMRNQDGVFEKACDVLRKLHNSGIVTAVSFIPTKRNMDELEDTIDFCESLGVASFRVQPLMVVGRARNHLMNYILSAEETRKIIRILGEKGRKNAIAGKMEITWGDPVEHLINLERNLRIPSFIIGAYGDIMLSPYIPLAFGNIRNHSILDYVSGGLYQYWNCNLYQTIASKMNTPENLYLQKFFDLPEIGNGLMSFDILDEDFKSISDDVIRKITKNGGE